MKFFTEQKFRKLLRPLHRDIGYLFVGLTCIYAISGILLNTKTEGRDPAYREIIIEDNIQPYLTPKELGNAWRELNTESPALNRAIPYKNIYRLYFKGGIGEYNPQDGKIICTTYKEIKAVKVINDIHYNSGKRFTWMANLFAVCLIFLAISGTFIVKGKKGFKKRGVWFVLAGLVIPIVLYFVG